MDGLYRSKSLADRRASMANSEEGTSPSPTRNVLTLDTLSTRMPARVEKIVQTRPRGPPTPNLTTPAELDSPTHSNHDPPPPPTPAASPGPDNMRPDWSAAGDQEDIFLAQIRQYFKQRSGPERTRILGDLLNLCTSQQLSFVSQYVSPLLKKDPFTSLPDELCLRVRLLSRHLRFRLLMFRIRCCHLLTMARSWPERHRSHEDGGIYWLTT
jgi:F-box and WD-40 domain protein CDC4